MTQNIRLYTHTFSRGHMPASTLNVVCILVQVVSIKHKENGQWRSGRRLQLIICVAHVSRPRYFVVVNKQL